MILDTTKFKNHRAIVHQRTRIEIGASYVHMHRSRYLHLRHVCSKQFRKIPNTFTKTVMQVSSRDATFQRATPVVEWSMCISSMIENVGCSLLMLMMQQH